MKSLLGHRFALWHLAAVAALALVVTSLTGTTARASSSPSSTPSSASGSTSSPAGGTSWAPPPVPHLAVTGETPRECAAPTRDRKSCLDELGRLLTDEQAQNAGSANAHAVADAAASGVPAATSGNKAGGYTPADIQSMYGLPSDDSASPTVAIVDYGQEANVEQLLDYYRAYFGLPQCTAANGCFKQVAIDDDGDVVTKKCAGADTAQPCIPAAGDWSAEIMLDVEAVSAACPSCHIELVEGIDQGAGLDEAAKWAASPSGGAADYVSMSWGSSEYQGEQDIEDPYYQQPNATRSTVDFFAAAGDDGYANTTGDTSEACPAGSPCVDYPATSPEVVAVGGTTVLRSKGVWHSSVWTGSGSGCSQYEKAPSYQVGVTGVATACSSDGQAMRGAVDVSALGDPATGLMVALDDGQGNPVWAVMGGTSLSTPLVAAMAALQGNHTKPWSMYANSVANPDSVTDITQGATTGCSESENPYTANRICGGTPGWDGPSGVGTPRFLSLFSSVTPDATHIALSPEGGVTVRAQTGVPFDETPVRSFGGRGDITWSVTSGSLPAGLTMSPSGEITGTPTQPSGATATVTVTASDSAGVPDQASEALTIQIVPPSLSVAAPGGSRITTYTGQPSSWAATPLQASGGTAPYSWSYALSNGSTLTAGLPAGLAGTSGGVISGVPTTPGTYDVVATVTDSSPRQLTTFEDLTIRVIAGAPPVVSFSQPNYSAFVGGSLNASDFVKFAANGDWGNAPCVSLAGEPSWLSVSTVTGHNVLTSPSLMPAQVGTYYVGLVGEPDIGPSGSPDCDASQLSSDVATVSISEPALSLTTPSTTVDGVVGAYFAAPSISVSGSSGSYTWSAAGLPAGVTIDPTTGIISGTPTVAGTYATTVTATDAGTGATGSVSLTGMISDQGAPPSGSTSPSGSPTGSPTSSPSGGHGTPRVRPVPPRDHRVTARRGTRLHVRFRARGGRGQRVWSARHLPQGIHLGKHGLLTGRVSWTGARTITVIVTSGRGRQATRGTMTVHLVGTRPKKPRATHR